MSAALPAPLSGVELGMLDRAERTAMGVRLGLALAAGGLLLLSALIALVAPDQGEVVELVAGGAALIVAVPALSAAWHSLRHPDLHGITDQLVALALIAAWASGDLVTAALLPLVMTIGHILEERSLIGSDEAIRALVRLTRSAARRRRGDGGVEEVPADTLRSGDLIELRAGDRVPADAVVREGHGSLDTSPITGESVPADVAPGSALLGGSINLDGFLVVEITRTGADSALGRVIALMQAAEMAKPPVTRLLERYVGRYLALVLLTASGVWLATGSVPALLAVLVASCPCALVLAAPATSIAAIAVAGRHGILVKGAAFLEHLATVNALVLDKTGTVTLGVLRLTQTLPAPGVEAAGLQRLAASIGAASNHPVSRAVAHAWAESDRLPLSDIRELPGLGILARSGDDTVLLGRPALLVEQGVDVPEPPAHDGPIVGVATNGVFQGWLALADEARPEARAAVADLRALGLRRQILLTGDRAPVAAGVGAYLAMDAVQAESLPAQKLEAVLAEMRRGYRPMVVGDGINDSLALRAGAVGVAMGARGTDAALASADLVLITNDLRRLCTAIRLSRRCLNTIHVNVAIGLGWTLMLIIAAGSGVLGQGGAVAAALLHNVGTLVVMANAGRLLRFNEP